MSTPTFSLASFTSGDTDYIAKLNSNNDKISSALGGAVSSLTATAPLMLMGDSTATLTISMLPFVGDIGGGYPPATGLIPVPSVGDAAAGKFLKADGTWSVPTGGTGSGTGGGSGAAGTVTIGGGAVLGVIVTSGGSGYTAPPTVVFHDSTGSGAVALATLTGGVVTGITVINGGTGYLAPTVSFNSFEGVTGLFPITSSGGSAPVISITDVVGDTGTGGARGSVPAPAPGDAAAGKFLKADGTWEVPGGSSPYDLVVSYIGKPGAGATIFLMVFVRPVSFSGSFFGSRGVPGTPPTSAATYNIEKNGAIIGTIEVSTSGTVTFTSNGGAVQNFGMNDLMTITAPSPQDATLANLAVTLTGTR